MSGSYYVPFANRGKHFKFTMLDGKTYVGLCKKYVQSSKGILWTFAFAHPNAPMRMIYPARCVETGEALSAFGPIADDSPQWNGPPEIGSNIPGLPPASSWPPSPPPRRRGFY